MSAAHELTEEDGIEATEYYRLAVEEYRFQAEYNWKRTQQMLVFNTAILAAGSAVASRTPWAILIFILGIVACGLTLAMNRTQHAYYRAARDRMRRIEQAINIPDDWRVDTTATLGGRKRIASVSTLVTVLLVAIALADATGAVLAMMCRGTCADP